MDQTTVKKPTGVTITAWLWIVMGGFMVFGGLMGGFAHFMIRQMGPPPAVPSQIPAGFALMNVVFEYFAALLVVQAVVAVLAVWAGIALLRLKAWARTTIEVLSWLAFVYCVGFGIFWIYLWVSMTGQIPKGGAPVDTHMFQIMGAVMGTIITIAFGVSLWIMIRYLRGDEVRAAIANAQQARA